MLKLIGSMVSPNLCKAYGDIQYTSLASDKQLNISY